MKLEHRAVSLFSGDPADVSIGVSVGPVYVSIQSCGCEHHRAARLADRAPCLGFKRFLAHIWPNRHLNGVQGVAGSNPAVPTGDKVYSPRALDALGEFSFLWGVHDVAPRR